MSVIECGSDEGSGCTPQTTASRRAVSSLEVRPRIGQSGRSRATRSVVEPVEVKVAIASRLDGVRDLARRGGDGAGGGALRRRPRGIGQRRASPGPAPRGR